MTRFFLALIGGGIVYEFLWVAVLRHSLSSGLAVWAVLGGLLFIERVTRNRRE